MHAKRIKKSRKFALDKKFDRVSGQLMYKNITLQSVNVQ